MASEIKDKFGTPTALTISLNSLASSTAGVGRQSTMVDNSTLRYGRILLTVKIKLGTSPTSGKSVQVYLLRSDGTIRDDAAGASDAGLTVLNAALVGVLLNKASGAATGDVIQATFVIDSPGPEWGVAIVHDTGVNLDSSAGGTVSYVGVNPEAQ